MIEHQFTVRGCTATAYSSPYLVTGSVSGVDEAGEPFIFSVDEAVELLLRGDRFVVITSTGRIGFWVARFQGRECLALADGADLLEILQQ